MEGFATAVSVAQPLLFTVLSYQPQAWLSRRIPLRKVHPFVALEEDAEQ